MTELRRSSGFLGKHCVNGLHLGIPAKSAFAAFLLIIILCGFFLSGVTRLGLAQGSATYNISGYILDSNGHGLTGAEIIFNVPQTVPSVYSDNTGHYVITAPAGTYHLNVWPPFDSSFLSYDQPALVVTSDTTKNITLASGYKVSGYIFDTSGKPVPKAIVLLNSYLCGWYSTASGYYFVTAPAGTYTLTARPGSGPKDAPSFPTYNENNFVVNGNLAKNITVAGTAPKPANTSSCKIWGYILDASGHGINGANIVFNVPDIVPSVYSDSTGYYAIYAPAGPYHVSVWPPFDSRYINYDEQGFVVTADMAKNIILNSGYKVSGYITSTSGTPVKDGIVSLNGYLSGWFSKDTGHYFVCVPAGTYKLTANPRSGYHHFSNYYESNFIVNSDIVKNITVVLTDDSTPSPNPNPEPTPTPLPDQGWISISVDTPFAVVGSVFNVSGRLTDFDGHPLAYQPVILSYADLDTVSWVWTHMGSANTTTTGEYNIQWVIAQSGSFLLKVEWAPDNNFARAMNTTSVSFQTSNDQYSMHVESSSIVSESANADAGYWIWAAAAAVIAILLISFIGLQKKRHRKTQEHTQEAS